MKKIFLFLLLFQQLAYSDILPENSHQVAKCVRIVNTNNFPDYFIIALIQSPTNNKKEHNLILPNECIDIGYKFNTLTIVAVKKEYLKNQDPDNLDWLNNKNIIKADLKINCSDGYIGNDDPTNSVEEYYKILEISNQNCLLYKYTEITSYNNGQPRTVKRFKYNQRAVTNPCKQIKHNSISEIYIDQEIFSFLKSLFLTISIELLFLYLILKTKYKHIEISTKRIFFSGVLMSVSTLPYVWFVLPLFATTSYSYTFTSEIFAIVFEALILSQLLSLEYKKTILISSLCNIVSFGIGFTLNFFTLL
ncbi:MAG: hypothetical protein QM535_03085 [Limnohabitans sp.]|nr:hypothetical protein [Limnohabitans sp.]